MDGNTLVFGLIDYCLFGVLLGISLSIGIYFGFFSKQNTTAEYLFGGKTMNYIPVAISILASFLSGITFLGTPTEIYFHGSQYWAATISSLLIGLASAYVTLPVFHDLQVSSCYEYLELRFSKAIRTLASCFYIVSLFMYIPIVIFVPALAFSQATGYNLYTITSVFSIICITYTSMGGVKAVVWTDTIQFVFTIGGLITVLTLGVISIGGLSEVWRIADEGGRIKLFDIDPSPFRRDTFWAISIGITFSMLSRFGLGQKFVQRFLAIENKSNMKKAIFLTTSGWAIIQVSCIFAGLIMYAEYHDCDPLKAKLIDRRDQILPYYVVHIAGHLPGLPGIFFAGLVSSALSTMSASLNTLSATIYQTLIDPWIADNSKKDVKATNIMKITSVVVGLINVGEVFVVQGLGTIFEMAISLSSATEGSLLGLFFLGLLFPWVGKKGAMTGACTSFIIMGWLVGGTQWHILNKRIKYPTLPTSVEGCDYPLNETLTFIEETSITEPPLPPDNEPMILFQISVVYFTLIGCIIAIVVACVTSYFTGEMSTTKVNPDHISPIIRRFLSKEKIYAEIPLKEIDTEKIIADNENKRVNIIRINK